MRRRTLEIVPACKEKQRGQAAVEYLVVTAVIVSALVAGGNSSVINQFCAAFRSLYRAYSFALSLA